MPGYPTRVLATIVVVVATAPPLFAQSATGDAPPLAAGRPGFTESRGTVGAGVLQFEAGLGIGLDPGTGPSARTLTAPSGVVRYGLGRRFELRAGGGGLTYASERVGTDRVTTRGRSDLYLGAKLVILDEARAGVAASIVPGFTLPTGSARLTSDGYDPSITVAVARALPYKLDTGGVWAVAGATRDGRHRAEYATSLALSRPLGGRLATFAEVFRVAGWQTESIWSLNGGLAMVLSGDAQIDVQVGRSVHNGSGWTLASGIVFRRTARRVASGR